MGGCMLAGRILHVSTEAGAGNLHRGTGVEIQLSAAQRRAESTGEVDE